MSPVQQQFFHNLPIGKTILTASVKNPEMLIQAAKDYVDHGGLLAISDDWSTITKQSPIPEQNENYF